MRRIRSVVGLVMGIVVTGVLISACSNNRSGSIPLPFREGVDDNSYEVTVEMRDAARLVPDSEVKVRDVTVGTVKSFRFDQWVAKLTVGLNGDVTLPANAVARIGQKSLLGAEYLQLAAPEGQASVGKLRAGDTIPLSRTSRYPETEEVLAALSVVLNGGGLQQLKTISTELNAALSGREGQVRAVIGDARTLIGQLEAHKSEILRAIDGVDQLSRKLAARNDRLAHAIRAIPGGIAALEDNRARLVEGLSALSRLGDVATSVINRSKDDLLANLHDLRPAVQKLADAGQNLTQSLQVIGTFPWPSRTAFPAALKGDYGNLFITVDLNPKVLARNFGVGFPSDSRELPMGGLPPLGGGVNGGDPLRLPLNPPQVKLPPFPLVSPDASGSYNHQDPSGPDSGKSSGNSSGLLDGLLGGGR